MQVIGRDLNRRVFSILVRLYKNCGNPAATLRPGVQGAPISVELDNRSLNDIAALPQA